MRFVSDLSAKAVCHAFLATAATGMLTVCSVVCMGQKPYLETNSYRKLRCASEILSGIVLFLTFISSRVKGGERTIRKSRCVAESLEFEIGANIMIIK